MTKRSAQRTEFLGDVMTAGVGGAYYWAQEMNSDLESDNPSIRIRVPDDNDKKYIVTLDTIAHGISVLTTGDNKGSAFSLSGSDYWRQFLLCNRTNGNDGDYDADIADNILQAGLFGEVTYG